MGDLNAMELFYWVAFLFGLGYAALGLVAGGLGIGGHEAEAGGAGGEHEVAAVDAPHADAAAHHLAGAGAHVSPLNSLTIAAFAVALGALGLLGLKYGGLGEWLSFGFAGTGALALAAAFFVAVVRPLYRSESTSSPDIHDLVRAPALVRTTIPAAGSGEVVYVAGGSRITMPARAAQGKEIPSGTRVAILRIRQGVAYVVLLEDEEEPAG